MNIVKKKTRTFKYRCPECKSIIEISDDEFETIKRVEPFPHIVSLEDFQKDTRIKMRVCDCPVCGGTIWKERTLYNEDKQ